MAASRFSIDKYAVKEGFVMGRYCYCATLKGFLKEVRSTWLSKMQTQFNVNSVMPLGQSQINARGDCFNVLQATLPDFENSHSGFSILFEYQLPYESGRRPDVILLSSSML